MTAVRSQSNSTSLPAATTLPLMASNILMSDSKGSNSVNNSLISDISRLLCVAQQQQQVPAVKRARLSSSSTIDNKSLTATADAVAAINAIKQHQVATRGQEEHRSLDIIPDSMNLRISINSSQVSHPPSQLSEVSVGSSANGAMSSTMSSPRVIFLLS